MLANPILNIFFLPDVGSVDSFVLCKLQVCVSSHREKNTDLYSELRVGRESIKSFFHFVDG